MSPRGRVLVLLAALLAAPLSLMGAAQGATDVTARLTGTLLAIPSEGDAATSYAVQRDGGELVGVAAVDFTEADAGAHFDGQVDVSRLSGSTPSARLALAADDSRPLRVTSYSLGEQAATQASTTHRWFVAAPSNFGALGMTDAEALARIGWVASYWTQQSNGVITDITVPGSITRYTATATTEAGGCGLTGLGSTFTSTVNEAAAQFPGASFGGSDQLIVLMPPSCVTGGTVGRGTVGSLSFSHGYYNIDIASKNTFEWTLAHELGHNYGYGHSSLGPCTTACTSEYGDYYSVMGGVVSGKPIPPALGTVSRQLQGITDAGEVETVTGSATRVLAPRSATTGLRSLQVTDPGTGQVLRLDYRSGTGADAGNYYAGGSTASSFRKGVVAESGYNSNAVQLVPGPASRKAMVPGDSLTLGTTTVEVTAMDADGATVVVTVPGETPAYPGPGTIALSPAPTAGSPVSAALSGWSPAPDSVDYQWLLDGGPIDGATSSSYTPLSGQVGHQLSVRAVAHASGYQAATVTSAAQSVSGPPITLVGRAAVSGTAQVGLPLTCDPPSWTAPPASVTTTFAWQSDGRSVTGATSRTLTPTAAERDTAITCRVTLSAAGYDDAASTSLPTASVAKGVLATTKPVARGRARVGGTLTADTGTWTDGVTFRYRWFVAGHRLRSQRTEALTLKGWMAGKKAKLVVVGKLPGYATVTRQSRARGPVKPA